MAAQENFVDALIKDPENIPNMVLLNGFAGKSSLAGYVRLYLNAVLNEYYEIPMDAILHTVKISASASNPLETVYIWVQAEAELLRKGKSCTDSKTRFFSGDILANQTAQAGAGADAAAVPPEDGPAVGPTGLQNCTQSPDNCADTAS